jgi:hypothetical protein
MINKHYKPSMKPELTKSGTIRITSEYLTTIEPTLSKADWQYLQVNLEGATICPGIFWLKDTERVRALLQYKAEEKV